MDEELFPDYLDHSKVLYYTSKDDYGKLYYEDGRVAAVFSYLAICKYDNDNGYYLFMCNDDFEVETDSLWDSVDQCMGVANSSCGGNVLWIKKD